MTYLEVSCAGFRVVCRCMGGSLAGYVCLCYSRFISLNVHHTARFDEAVRLLQAFHLTAANEKFPTKRYSLSLESMENVSKA